MDQPPRENFDSLIAKAFEDQAAEAKLDRPHRVLALEYFVAGVPPFQLFELYVDGLSGLLKNEDRRNDVRASELAPLCMIGLAAYFEAFFKDLFSALLNICPKVAEELCDRRDCKLGAREVIHLISGSNHNFGSILSEQYDWGSGKSVNGIFTDLLKVTPFSKDMCKLYEEFLGDRNLLVHHGGVYTFKYAKAKWPNDSFKEMIHWHSLIISDSDVLTWAKMFIGIAGDTSLASARGLREFVARNDIQLDPEAEKALRLFNS